MTWNVQILLKMGKVFLRQNSFSFFFDTDEKLTPLSDGHKNVFLALLVIRVSLLNTFQISKSFTHYSLFTRKWQHYT